MSETKNKAINELSIEDADLELKRLQVEKARLENARLLRDIGKLENQESSDAANDRVKGIALEQTRRDNEASYRACNHLKGGTDQYFQGDGRDGYAVCKYKVGNGDIHVRCLRCGKVWLPLNEPLLEEFKNKEDFKEAMDYYKSTMREYAEALSFRTDNCKFVSEGVTFKYPNQKAERAARNAFSGIKNG